MTMFIENSNAIPLVASGIILGVVITPFLIVEYSYLFDHWVVSRGVQTVDQPTAPAVVAEVQTVEQATAPTVEVGVQTIEQATENIGVQTTLMFENILSVDSIAEYPNVDFPIMSPTILPQTNFVDEVGVQTDQHFLFRMFINWVKEQLSLQTPPLVEGMGGAFTNRGSRSSI